MNWILTLLQDPTVRAVVSAIAIAGITAVLAFGGRAIVAAWATFRTNALHQLDASQLALIDVIASRAVRYAEQVLKSEPGQAKLAEATRLVSEQAALIGIVLTPEQLRIAVEAALVDLKLDLAAVAA